MSLSKNGTGYAFVLDGNPHATYNSHMSLVTGVISVVENDYFEVSIFQDSGSPINVLGAFNKYFSIERKE